MASGASKLIPSDPDKVMVIRQLQPSLMIFSTPFLRFGRIAIGGRGTVVRLQNGSLAVFSPVALTDTVKQRIQSDLGTLNVQYLAALDQEHHIFLESWHKEYPHAKIIGPETLPGLRDKQNYFQIPAQNWVFFKKADQGRLTVDAAFDSEFDMEYIDGHQNKECVFNHRPTRTLIEADLLFNLPATEQMSRTGQSATGGIWTRIFTAINNTVGQATWQKRLIWYAISSGDRPGFNQSVSRIAKWDFDRIIPCHGDVMETDGKGIFEKIMAWHLAAARKAA